MKKFIIALKNLNIEDSTIIKIINNYSINELKELFLNYNDVITEKDLQLLKYKELFNNKYNLEKALKKADYILNENKKHGIKTLIYNNRYFPENLKKINNPPPILYIKGANISKKHGKSLACVGTRNPSKFSVNATNYLIPQWTNEEFVIISGLAEGVDTLAHISCLESNGITIAVLAHGLDTIYPKGNNDLADRILNNGGTLLSEYPVGTKADKFRFVNRNRLIVGLAKGTVVFEAKIKSGTMHAAEFTIEQGKSIFCPNPGNELSNENLEGLRYLIQKKNAITITNGASFEIPIFALGYTLKHSPLHMYKLKETYIKSILKNNNTEVNVGEVLKNVSNKDLIKRKSIMVNSNQYEVFKMIAEDNHLSVKELMNIIIENVVINNK